MTAAEENAKRLYALEVAIRDQDGEPIEFDAVLVGDTIRAHTIRGTGVVAHTAGTVESTTSRYLTGPGGITIAVRDWEPTVYLIHRPAPTEA